MSISSLSKAAIRTRGNRPFAVLVRTIRVLLFCLAALPLVCKGQVLNIVGSSAMDIPIADAAQMLRADLGMEVHISTSGGSNAGIAAVGDEAAQIAMSTRPLTPEDRADSPEVNFTQIYVGQDVVALGVSGDVWEAGVHALTRVQLRAIYAGKITNWKQVGGPDESIVFFNSTEGRGVWEIFIEWIYGDSKRAPLGHFPIMTSNEEARNSVEFTRGSMSMLSPKFIDGKSVFALALEGEDGKGYFPVPANIVSGKYPLMKPMYFVVNDKPTGDAKTLIDFMFDNRGRTLLNKCGYYSLDEMKIADPDFQPPK